MILEGSIECPNCNNILNWAGEVSDDWINEFTNCDNCGKEIEIDGYVKLILDCAKVSNYK